MTGKHMCFQGPFFSCLPPYYINLIRALCLQHQSNLSAGTHHSWPCRSGYLAATGSPPHRSSCRSLQCLHRTDCRSRTQCTHRNLRRKNNIRSHSLGRANKQNTIQKLVAKPQHINFKFQVCNPFNFHYKD